jgi:hypothetical protein
VFLGLCAISVQYQHIWGNGWLPRQRQAHASRALEIIKRYVVVGLSEMPSPTRTHRVLPGVPHLWRLGQPNECYAIAGQQLSRQSSHMSAHAFCCLGSLASVQSSAQLPNRRRKVLWEWPSRNAVPFFSRCRSPFAAPLALCWQQLVFIAAELSLPYPALLDQRGTLDTVVYVSCTVWLFS